MRREFRLQEIDQRGVHEFEVVGDAQDDEGFVAEFAREAFRDTGSVGFLHAENHVRPTDVPGGELDARAVFRAGGARIVTRMILEQRLRRGAAPVVPRADEEKFGLQGEEGGRCGVGAEEKAGAAAGSDADGGAEGAAASLANICSKASMWSRAFLKYAASSSQN